MGGIIKFYVNHKGTLPVHRPVTVPGTATVTWMIPAHILVSGETFLGLWERVQCHRPSESGPSRQLPLHHQPYRDPLSHSSPIYAAHELTSWLEQVKDEGGKKLENVECLRGRDYPYHEFSGKESKGIARHREGVGWEKERRGDVDVGKCGSSGSSNRQK